MSEDGSIWGMNKDIQKSDIRVLKFKVMTHIYIYIHQDFSLQVGEGGGKNASGNCRIRRMRLAFFFTRRASCRWFNIKGPGIHLGHSLGMII